MHNSRLLFLALAPALLPSHTHMTDRSAPTHSASRSTCTASAPCGQTMACAPCATARCASARSRRCRSPGARRKRWRPVTVSGDGLLSWGVGLGALPESTTCPRSWVRQSWWVLAPAVVKTREACWLTQHHGCWLTQHRGCWLTAHHARRHATLYLQAWSTSRRWTARCRRTSRPTCSVCGTGGGTATPGCQREVRTQEWVSCEARLVAVIAWQRPGCRCLQLSSGSVLRPADSSCSHQAGSDMFCFCCRICRRQG